MTNPPSAARLCALFGVLSVCVGQSAPADQSGAPLTIRSSTQEVALDLVVRDAHGRLVRNLQESEIQILEDGVPQQIRSFKLVNGRPAPRVQPEAVPPQPGVSQTSTLPSVNVVCIVFHKLDVYTRKFAVDAAQEFLRYRLPPGSWAGIFNLDAALTTLHPFSTNRDELIAAAAGAATGTGADFMSTANAVLSSTPTVATVVVDTSGNPASGGSVSTSLSVSGGELNTEAITGADVSSGSGEKILRGQRAIQRRQFGWIEGMRQTDQMLLMIEELRRLPGRKTVLLFSSGLASTGDPERFDSILSKANQAGITIYSIDVNGLTQNSNVVASNAAVRHAGSLGRSRNIREQMLQDDYLHDAVRTADLQATLRTLAEGTGGFLIGNTNDLRKPFQQVLADLDTHYEVIYHPESVRYDGHFRNISAKPARPGLVVQSRAGYFAMPALHGSSALLPYEIAALTALNATPPPHAFEFQSAAMPFHSSREATQCVVAMQLPAAAVGASELPGSDRRRVHVSFFALVQDTDGQVVEKLSQDSPYDVPATQLQALRAKPLSFGRTLDLAPGRYTLRSAILDHEAHRVSTSVREFEVPTQPGVGLSAIVLARSLEPAEPQEAATDPLVFSLQSQPRRVEPELNLQLAPGGKPSVYFVVYPDGASRARPRLRMIYTVSGKVVADSASEIGAAGSSAPIPLIVAAASHPGECELRITVEQGEHSATQSLRYTVAR